jgi:hypothetical protein
MRLIIRNPYHLSFGIHLSRIPAEDGVLDHYPVSNIISIKAQQLCVKYKRDVFELSFALEKGGI